MKLLYPNMMRIDEINTVSGQVYEKSPRVAAKPWGEGHDLQLRLIFLKFFAAVLSGYRHFIENTVDCPFNAEALIMQRSRSSNQPPDPMMIQFLGSQGFSNYIARVIATGDDYDVLDKLIDATGRGQNPISIFSLPLSDPVVITIPDPTNGILGSGAKYTYNRFPSNVRTEEQVERRKQILQCVMERNAEDARLIFDIKVKLKGLWFSLTKLEAADAILLSDEYETILALIETDSQGIVGSAFIEGIREHMNTGWNCNLSEKLFIAVKDLVKGVVTHAFYRNDMRTLRDALEVSAEIYRKDFNGVLDFIQRHLFSLPIWEDSGFWETFFDYLMEQSSSKSSSNESHILAQLIFVASHMGGLGIPDTVAWPIIENIAQMNNIDYEHYVQLRGYLSYIHQLHMVYWGISDLKAQTLSSYGLKSPHPQDATCDNQQPSDAPTFARSWVRSMFGREAALKVNSFSRARGWTVETETSATNEIGTPRKQILSNAGQKKLQANVRILRGHRSSITALHCVTRREVCDLVGDREDSGFFISGSTDCSVKIWDPSHRGSELRATLRGHIGAVRAISSDRWKVISGSDDLSILVWDKHEFVPLEELKGHEAPVSCLRMLSGDRILSSAHDGTVKMWDARIGSCIGTVAHCPGAVLCMEYDDTTGILVAAGRDSVVHVWDIRAGKHIHKLLGHTKWIRSIRMVGDSVITGSNDWTARVWSISRGACDAVLACHTGPVLCVDYSEPDKGIITGSDDGFIRFWENASGIIKCAKDVNLHSPILSINVGEHWLGTGAADNSMLLFNQPQERSGGFSNSGTKCVGWQLYRTPQASAAVVRYVASDLERKRICSGGRDGLLRLWDATISL